MLDKEVVDSFTIIQYHQQLLKYIFLDFLKADYELAANNSQEYINA